MDEPYTHTTTSEVSPEDGIESIPLCPFLFVVIHCDQPSLGGARYNLTDIDVVNIGRGSTQSSIVTNNPQSRELDIRLPSRKLSKSHAQLVRQGGAWFLSDAGSRNGCYVGGRQISRVMLNDGDYIEMGSIILRFRAALPTPKGCTNNIDLGQEMLNCSAMQTLLPQVENDLNTLERVARSTISTLLIGETGTGKEVLARCIHAISNRPGPFVAVNCGALTPSLLETQLFGHVKGAFTGALRDEPGFIRAANGGTLFLDEFGDLSLPAQAALLRVLQEREVVPVGGTRPIAVDIRIIAATQEPLERACLRGEFRTDLLARVAGHQQTLAPLSTRMEDLGLIIGNIMRRVDTTPESEMSVSAAVARRFLTYTWPLNIRELEQTLALGAALAEHPNAKLDQSLLPSRLVEESIPPAPPVPEWKSPEELQRILVALFEKHRGNISYVAKEMGKSRIQIHRWMQRFDIRVEDYRT